MALAAEPARRRGRAGGRAALGHGPGAGGLPRRGAGRRCRGLLRRLPRDRRRLPGRVVVLPGRRVDLRRLDRSRPTRWPAAGSTSGCAGSPSTWSACRCCCTRTSTRRPCSTAIYGVVRHLGLRRPGCGWRATEVAPHRRRRRRDRTRCRHDSDAAVRLDPVEQAIADIAAGKAGRRRRRRGPRERGRPGRRPRRRRRRSCSPSWSGTRRASSACRWRARARPAQAAADDRGQRGPQAHRLLGLGRRPRRHQRPASRPPTGRRPSGCSVDSATEPLRADPARPRLPAARRARAACCGAPGTPRPPSTWRGSPGCTPAGVIAEVVNDDGTMARLPDLRVFADEHGLALVSIADLIACRRRTETLVEPGRRGRAPDPPRRVPRPSATASTIDGVGARRAGPRRDRRRDTTCSCGCTPSA